MRLIVCGGREFSNYDRAAGVLTLLNPLFILVHGDARGADKLAAGIWEGWGRAVEAHPADWRGRGKMAGLERNRIMLELGARGVLAFPGGTGTANMVTIARDAGLAVLYG